MLKINVAALAAASALLWGSCVLLVGLANMAVPGYGAAFLKLIASIYPGYDPNGSFLVLLLATTFALADGAIGGGILGWLYNVIAAPADRERRAVSPHHDMRHPMA
jgi:hypothetical protein